MYLGGLHPGDRPALAAPPLPHCRSGEILLDSGVPTIVLQAGVIIGSGSTSFEMIRHLTEVLPYMPAPRWVRSFIQPIAVRDVLHYLIRAAEVPPEVNRAFDIGGPDVYRYGQLMNGYAVEAGLPQRPIAALPVLTPWLAGQWVNLVTPIPRRLAVPIIESLQFDCVMREHDIDGVIPPPSEGLLPYRTAVRLALEREREGEVETSWRNAEVEGAPSDPLPSDPDWAGHTVYVDERERRSTAPPAELWRVIEGVGGENGWYSFPLAWAMRGWVDKLTGGVGCGGGAATRHAARRRRRRLLAGRGDRARQLPASCARRCGCRVAPGSSSGPSTAPDAAGSRLPAARRVLPEGPLGSAVLVGDLPVPRHHLLGHGEPDHGRGRGGGRGTRTEDRRWITKR